MSNRAKKRAMKALIPFVQTIVHGQLVLAALQRGYSVKLEKPKRKAKARPKK